MDREKDPIHLLLPMLPKLCRLAIKKVCCFLLRGSAPAMPPPPLLPLLAFKFTWSSKGDDIVQCVVLASLISDRTDWAVGRGGLSQCRLLSW